MSVIIEEPLDFERKRDHNEKKLFEKHKIKYAREFLLSFTGFYKLPSNFDLKAVSLELDGEIDGQTDDKKISPLYGLLVTTRSDLELPGEKWEIRSPMMGKENQSPVNSSYSERSSGICQFSPGLTGNNAGTFAIKNQKNDLSQLRKSQNPYRPPHWKGIQALKETGTSVNKVCWQESSLLGQHHISSDKHYETNFTYFADKACVAQRNEGKRADAGGITQSASSWKSNNHDSQKTADNILSSSLQMNDGGPINTKKMLQATDATSEFQMLSLGDFSVPIMGVVEAGAVDSMAGYDKFECGFPFPEELGSSKTVSGKCKASWKNNEGCTQLATADKVESEMIEDNEIQFDDVWAEISESLQLEQQSPTIRFGDFSDPEVELCLLDDDSSKSKEGWAQLSLADKVESEMIEDNEIQFDDVWAEISESLQLEQQSPTTRIGDLPPDSGVDVRLLDEDSSQSSISKSLKFISLNKYDEEDNSEAEITLPDDDSLISIEDLIFPQCSIPSHGTDSVEADKLRPDMAVNNKNLENSTKLDRYAKSSSKEFSTHGKPRYQQSHSWNVQRNLLMSPSVPSLNWYTYSPSLHQPFQKTALASPIPNSSLVQYSLTQQPYVGFQQQNLLRDSKPFKQVTTPDLSRMQCLPRTSQQTLSMGNGTSNKGTPRPSMGRSSGGQVSSVLNNGALVGRSSQPSGQQTSPYR